VNNERLKKYPRLWVFFVLLLSLSGDLFAAEINVAVASNFKTTLQKLAADFKGKTGHELIISSASSGKLYAQIKHGAPYDVFLSADEKRVDLLLAENIAGAESAYIYALGKLVLISNIAPPTVVNGQGCKQVLTSSQLRWLAISNPDIAPYGLAAKQVIDKLGLWQRLRSRIVMGENIAQAFQFVSTKNAEAGFVAESMLRMAEQTEYVCTWHVPAELYSPIKQKMLLLKKAKGNLAANVFLLYMKSVEAKEIIKSAGYDVL